jgi:hypothetical protein
VLIRGDDATQTFKLGSFYTLSVTSYLRNGADAFLVSITQQGDDEILNQDFEFEADHYQGGYAGFIHANSKSTYIFDNFRVETLRP